MFFLGDRVVESVAHPRRGADFGPELVGRCYSREQAVFAVRVPPAGSWGEIGPLPVQGQEALAVDGAARRADPPAR
jgi:hypothetical protein